MKVSDSCSTLIALLAVQCFFSLIFAISSIFPRIRKLFVLLYAITIPALSLTLLHIYLESGKPSHLGSLGVTWLGITMILVANLLPVAALLYCELSDVRADRPGLLFSSVSLGSFFVSLSFLVTSVFSYALLLAGIIFASGMSFFGKRESIRACRKAFLFWLSSDAIFLIAAVLSWLLLDETSLFIKPPLIKGSEASAFLVVFLFFISALMRFGLFPFNFWVSDLARNAEPGWNAAFTCCFGFLIGAYRLLIACVLAARILTLDWGLAITFTGILSCLAALFSFRFEDTTGLFSVLYAMQAGFLCLGLGLYSRGGLAGALLLMVFAPISLSAHLMASGVVTRLRGTTSLFSKRIDARFVPAAFIAMLFSIASLAGCPPLDGFVGKSFVVISSLDRMQLNPIYSVVSFLSLFAIVGAFLISIYGMSGVFTGSEKAMVIGQRRRFESVIPLGMCIVSFLFGVLPGILLSNVIEPASKEIFPPNWTGPAVSFRATGTAFLRALGSYSNWAESVSAFLLCVFLFSLAIYFLKRRLVSETK